MIRPYKWHYGAMLMAPILGAFYDVASNYALKLVVDAFSQTVLPSYSSLLAPILLFIAAQVFLDVLWRASDIAEWRSEPYVRQAIILEVYERIQRYPYLFFQNTQAGTISSKIKGIVDGYDHFWAAMHHDFTPNLANTIVLTAALALVNLKVCLFVSLWGIGFFLMMYAFSRKMDKLSFINANDRHSLFGLIADNIANILTVFSFATRKKESAKLKGLIEERFIPSMLKLYKFSFVANSVAAVFYWMMLISLFLFMIHLRKTEQVSTGDLVFVMSMTIKMSWDLWQMIKKMQDFMKDIGDFKSAFTLLQNPQAEETSTMALNITQPSIDFEHVCFAYEGGAYVSGGALWPWGGHRYRGSPWSR